MQYFAVFFTAIVALSVASPVELEERQDFINTIIEMVKGFICGMDKLPMRRCYIFNSY